MYAAAAVFRSYLSAGRRPSSSSRWLMPKVSILLADACTRPPVLHTKLTLDKTINATSCQSDAAATLGSVSGRFFSTSSDYPTSLTLSYHMTHSSSLPCSIYRNQSNGVEIEARYRVVHHGLQSRALNIPAVAQAGVDEGQGELRYPQSDFNLQEQYK